MQDILKEYGPAIITVVAILALIALVTALIGSDADSPIGKAFMGLIDGFFKNAQQAIPNHQRGMKYGRTEGKS